MLTGSSSIAAATGVIHQMAAGGGRLGAEGRGNATVPPRATRQSSPMMKSYQNAPKARSLLIMAGSPHGWLTAWLAGRRLLIGFVEVGLRRNTTTRMWAPSQGQPAGARSLCMHRSDDGSQQRPVTPNCIWLRILPAKAHDRDVG